MPCFSVCQTVLACPFTADSEHLVPPDWLGDGDDVDVGVRVHAGGLPVNLACHLVQLVKLILHMKIHPIPSTWCRLMGLVTPATPMAEISFLKASDWKSVNRKFVELTKMNSHMKFERLECMLRCLNRPKKA